jgi:hypothetical protein
MANPNPVSPMAEESTLVEDKYEKCKAKKER